MFTGIIEELGEIVGVGAGTLSVRGSLVTSDAFYGASIAVNGVCLTVVEIDSEVFTVEVMGETYRRTALGDLTPGQLCNLERAVTPATRLGGHIVQGHIDGVATVMRREPETEWETVGFSIPDGTGKYIVEKGSIAVDGVSLTVASVTDTEIIVGLIPTTMKLTSLGHKGVGDLVHIETDVLARHLEKLNGARS